MATLTVKRCQLRAVLQHAQGLNICRQSVIRVYCLASVVSLRQRIDRLQNGVPSFWRPLRGLHPPCDKLGEDRLFVGVLLLFGRRGLDETSHPHQFALVPLIVCIPRFPLVLGRLRTKCCQLAAYCIPLLSWCRVGLAGELVNS
ncbi:hypothetical protein D3C71_1514540 [compost metagenome]